jgi:hypothetical protein
VRVDADLATVATRVRNRGRPAGGANLNGAIGDADYALEQAGFSSPKVKKTGDLKRMVVYTCRPRWARATPPEVVARLERLWTRDAAFDEEAHAISVGTDFSAAPGSRRSFC